MARCFSRCALLLSLILIGGCASGSVTLDWDRDFDFGDYVTFAWRERNDQQSKNPRNAVSGLVDERIKRELTGNLAAKGFDEVSARQADFVVVYYTGFRRQVVTSHSGYGGGRWYGGFRSGTSMRRSYPVGSLVVDVIDATDRRLVWRGVSEGCFGTTSPSDEKVAKVVTKLMKKFPPVG